MPRLHVLSKFTRRPRRENWAANDHRLSRLFKVQLKGQANCKIKTNHPNQICVDYLLLKTIKHCVKGTGERTRLTLLHHTHLILFIYFLGDISISFAILFLLLLLLLERRFQSALVRRRIAHRFHRYQRLALKHWFFPLWNFTKAYG